MAPWLQPHSNTDAGSQAINQSLYPKLPFDSVKAFQTVATLAVTPFFLIVNPSVPSVLPHVNTGRVRAIAVSSAKRSEAELRQTKLFAVEQLRFERSRAYQRRNRLRRDSVRRAALLRYVHEDSVR